jgi:hypothetical protein
MASPALLKASRRMVGIEAAKKKGVYKGRKTSVPVDEVRKLHWEGKGACGDRRGAGRVPDERLEGFERMSGIWLFGVAPTELYCVTWLEEVLVQRWLPA